jgi:ferredoxin-NADP reductase
MRRSGMKLRDLQGLFRKSEITLAGQQRAGGDLYTFDFTYPATLSWRPGEHGMFSLRSKGVRGRFFRAFSVASVPDERIIKIATRIPAKASAFKRALLALQVGDTITMRGPFGWFTLQDESSPVLMIAAGVGVTPFRALFKQLSGGNSRRVRLIYSASQHLFREELEAIASADHNVSIELVADRDEAEERVTEYILEYGSHGYFYIAGAPAMIRAQKKVLKSLGVRGKQIINDPFLGY